MQNGRRSFFKKLTSLFAAIVISDKISAEEIADCQKYPDKFKECSIHDIDWSKYGTGTGFACSGVYKGPYKYLLSG